MGLSNLEQVVKIYPVLLCNNVARVTLERDLFGDMWTFQNRIVDHLCVDFFLV
jgi:hypothetical protein